MKIVCAAGRALPVTAASSRAARRAASRPVGFAAMLRLGRTALGRPCCVKTNTLGRVTAPRLRALVFLEPFGLPSGPAEGW